MAQKGKKCQDKSRESSWLHGFNTFQTTFLIKVDRNGIMYMFHSLPSIKLE